MIAKVLLSLPIVLIFAVLADAQKCSSQCRKCTGDDYCVVKNSSSCQQGNIDCSDDCLDIDIRTNHCFKATLVKNNNCDPACAYCITQYKCNGAMESVGWCHDGSFKCSYDSKCVAGEAKALCDANSNSDRKSCGESCDQCFGNDYCGASNSTSCIKPPATECNHVCMHNSARNKLCFASSMPSATRCSKKRCDYCVKQFKCNKNMEALGICKKGHVDCFKMGQCLDGEAKAKCVLTTQDCSCDYCFKTAMCKKGSVEELHGYCEGGKLKCSSDICVAKRAFDKQCLAIIGGFCNFHKYAPLGAKIGCVAAIIAGASVVLCVLWACFCMDRGVKSPQNVNQQNVNEQSRAPRPRAENITQKSPEERREEYWRWYYSRKARR